MFLDRCHHGCDDPRASLGKARTVGSKHCFRRRITALKRVIY
jgi:hypothetical protein